MNVIWFRFPPKGGFWRWFMTSVVNIHKDKNYDIY